MARRSRLLKWQIDALPGPARRALAKLADQKWLGASKWYLAGGTALALQVGHRKSLDLDFFTTQETFQLSRLEKKLAKIGWTSDIVREGTLYGKILGAKVSFIAYQFFIPLEPKLQSHAGNIF